MNRHRSKRSLKTLIGQLVVPPAVAAALVASAQTASAQTPKPTPASQGSTAGSKTTPRAQAEALLKQAKSELKKGQFKAARDLAEKARTADAKLPGVTEFLREVSEAEAKAASKANATKVDTLLKQADAERKAGRYDAALATVAKALELDSRNSKALSLKTRVESERVEATADAVESQVKARIKAAKNALDDKKFDAARAQEAEARNLAKGAFKKELDALAKEIGQEEADFLAEKNAGAVDRLLTTADQQLKQNQFDAARESLTKAQALDKGNKKVASKLADLADAEKEFKAGQSARDAAKLVAEGNAAAKAGRTDEALAKYREALAKDPKSSEARKGIKNAEESLTNANEAKVKAVVAKGEAALKAGRTEDAKAALAEAKTLAPKSSAVAELEKDILASQKKAGEAKKEADAKAQAAAREAEKKAREAKEAEAKRLAAAAKTAATPVVKTPVPTPVATPVAPVATPLPTLKTPVPTPVPTPEVKIATATPVVATPVVSTPVASTPSIATPTPVPTLAPISTPRVTTPAPAKDDARRLAEAKEAEARRAAQARQAEAKKLADAKAAEAKKAAEIAEAKKEAEERAKKAAERKSREDQASKRQQAEQAYSEGVELYRRGELARARQRWLDAKTADPTFVKADSYLKETEAEYNAFLKTQQGKEDFDRREAEAVEKMATLVVFRTSQPVPLSEFLQILRVYSGIDFVVAGEVKAKVEVAFDDQPLSKVLDSVLLPMGLRWEREPGSDTIVISPDLRTEVFSVLPEQLNTLDSLIKEGVIQRLLYGPAGEPILQGQEILTDPRQNIVIVTDSEKNLEKFRRFLEGLKAQQGTQLVFDSFNIDETKAAQVKALLDAILSVDDAAPYNTERKLILEGGTLIIKDTPENVQKVRETLQDEKFLKNFYSDKLSVRTFNLTPIVDFEDNPDLVRQFVDNVKHVVETLLYAQEGVSKAEREGRRMWYDNATRQLTITDYPDRLDAVENFIESLPQIRSRKRSKIITLEWATASELVGQIETFVGAGQQAQTTTATGNELIKTLRVEDEINFNGGVFRVTRVNENDLNDDNDDSVEMVVRTGTSSQDVTLEEFRSEFIEDFEIVAQDISPSNTPGEGRARLQIRYVPGGEGGGGEGAEATPTPAAEAETTSDGPQFSLAEIENLNSIFVQYDNIEDLRQVEFWVKTLDIPTPQVSIEVKFVEVITNKSKEFKPEFAFGDLTEGVDLSDSVLRSRFAQDRDQYQSPYDPQAQSADSANLLKGTTVFNYIVSSGNSPISFTLRVLEAQGVVNIVNGPTVTVLNQQTADFEVERQFGTPQPLQGSTGGGGTGGSAQLTAVASIRPVELSVTPVVTLAGNITLDIDVEMQDFDQNLAQLDTLQNTAAGTATAIPQVTFRNRNEFGVLRKQLTTQARIRDGGTVVLGGWRSERKQDLESGIPILSDIPFVGPLLFTRTQNDKDTITLLIFLTGQVVKD